MNQSPTVLVWVSCFIFFVFCTTAHANQANRLLSWSRTRRLDKSNQSPPFGQRKTVALPSSVFVGSRETDKIHALPGQPPDVNFTQYAGYVTVDPNAGRVLFYYFAEATQEARFKPLVLWLNGGPGCSSLGAGAMMELGPFFVNRDGKTLYQNKFAWNNEANMLFVETPAGVGFSYSNRTSDYGQSGDSSTANDNHAFLVNWLERFPEYKGRDFYITGESYAGHYIPQLANAILRHNRRRPADAINLKGIAIGNAYLDDVINEKGTYDFFWTHALISRTVYRRVTKTCDFARGDYSPECLQAMMDADDAVGRLDHYDIYGTLCNEDSPRASASNELVNPADPCAELYVLSYLNLPEVQRSLHANTTGLNYPWTECSNLVGSAQWRDAPRVMLPEIKKLVQAGIRTWLYSGDMDSVVPFTATRYSLDMLELPEETAWRAWYAGGEVGGYVVGYRGLVFATVRAAGHLVPMYQPERALALFKSFLGGILPPKGA